MSKIIQTILLTLIGAACFSGGIYYGLERSEHYLERVMEEYEVISNKVDAFEKVSDPKTIRLYVKELNKILDEILFLGYIVESGQLADEALTGFFESYQSKLDSVNNRILSLHSELLSSVEQLKQEDSIQDSKDKVNTSSINSLHFRLSEQIDYVNQLNVDIGQSLKQLEDNVQTIKSSKYGKKIWTVKK
jgi:archaellum component FlaC|tara:strand:- start:109 stop:678 length:570 start_codon:yes stop_codon:yes gene_type:complete